MIPSAPTFSQIKAQVSAVRKKIPHARTIAIRTPGRWTGETLREDGPDRYSIHQCDSPLAMRVALREGDESAIKVLITDVDERDVGDDVLLRLKPRKLVPLDNWQIVKSLFQARTIDPRLTREPWIAELLMELIPPQGFAPVTSGFLDAETVWAFLLDRVMGLDAESPDLLSILKWSTDAENVARFREASTQFRNAAIRWLTSLAGPTATPVLQCVARLNRPDALPIGLAAGVVFDPNAGGKLKKAEGKLEVQYLGGESPNPTIIANWNAAATDVVRIGLSDARLKQQLLGRADEILVEVGADSLAWLSDTSPVGFDLRLASFGGRLSEVLGFPEIRITDTLVDARNAVLQHDRYTKDSRRLERVEMAMRLVRWLAAGNTGKVPQTLAEASADYLLEGGYIDRARLSLRSGEQISELSEAFATLFKRTTEFCEQRSRVFAGLLRDWTAAKSTDETIVPVEQILDRILAPLAAQTPLLAIVIDGMSVAVFRELIDDILRSDWMLMAEEGIGLRPAMATVPSVTEVSRTSLLCGQLRQGDSTTEKAGFAEHPGLLAHCRSGSPPVLFHKATLQEAGDSGLAADIRKEIGSKHRRIVAAVVNAVDDHLLKGQQIDVRWSLDAIKVLPTLLHEARAARRVVVLLSDHGHILDHGTTMGPAEGKERWRSADVPPVDGEYLIEGGRVMLAEGQRLIAPWTESLRYSRGVRNGYHGGITLQEMIVPIAVLCSNDSQLAGWVEAPVDTPSWWESQPSKQPELGPENQAAPKLKPQPPKVPTSLFDLDEEEVPQAVTSKSIKEAVPTAPWIKALFASTVFEGQKKFGGRAVPTDDVLEQMLAVIDSQGGKVTSAALARAIECSPMRLRSLIAAAGRVFNIDGYKVLSRDAASDTVQLDRDLLLRQFDLVE